MASFYSGDHVGAVVVDIGAAYTKMGWAGDDAPRSLFRSVRKLPAVLRKKQRVFVRGVVVVVVLCGSIFCCLLLLFVRVDVEASVLSLFPFSWQGGTG
jgi:hypothetical protein